MDQTGILQNYSNIVVLLFPVLVYLDLQGTRCLLDSGLIVLVPTEDLRLHTLQVGLFRVMVFYATFNNSSIISWWSVLLVEETRGRGENHRPVASC